jgi:DNA-binding CsgD family transcriptional regulator
MSRCRGYPRLGLRRAERRESIAASPGGSATVSSAAAKQAAWPDERAGSTARTVTPRRVRWAVPVLAGVGAVAVKAYGDQLPFGELAVGAGLAPLYAMVAVAPGVLLVAAGALAHRIRPASRIGLLLVAEGVGWNIGTLTFAATYVPAAAELSTLVVFLGYAIGAHVLLAYPGGRLRDRGDRVLVALLYLTLGPGLIATYLFHGDYGPGCPVCLANGFLLTPDATLDVASNAAWYALTALLVTVAGLRSVPRWRAASVAARRSIAPVYLTRWALTASIAVWATIGAAIPFADTTVWTVRAQIVVNVAAVAAAAGILVVFVASTAARGAAGELARALESSDLPLPGRLEAAVRSALGDPTARLLFAHPATADWVGSDGRPTAARPGRSMTRIAPGSALEHDPALDDDPTVVESVGAVAELALESERLRALLRARPPVRPGEDGLRDFLTAREREVLALAADGLTDAAIAQRLYVTRRTVETHLGHIFAKLDVPAGSTSNRRVHAVRRFLEAGRPAP